MKNQNLRYRNTVLALIGLATLLFVLKNIFAWPWLVEYGNYIIYALSATIVLLLVLDRQNSRKGQ